jgi:hypothetical protein
VRKEGIGWTETYLLYFGICISFIVPSFHVSMQLLQLAEATHLTYVVRVHNRGVIERKGEMVRGRKRDIRGEYM